MSTQNVSNNGAASANAAAVTTQDNRRDAAATAQSQRPGQGLWADDRMYIQPFPGPVKPNPAEAKRLQKEINRLAGEIAKIYANPKGPKGTLTPRQQERIEFLERRLEVALKKLANLNGPERPNWPPICQPPVEGPFPMPAPGVPPVPPQTTPPSVPTGTGGSGRSLAGQLDDLDKDIAELQKTKPMTNEVADEISNKLRLSQRLSNLLDQINTTETNREKARHETKMAVIRHFA